MLSEEAKEYIEKNKILLQEDRFQEFFNECRSGKCKIAEFFLFDCDINFLEYMTEIPKELFWNSSRLKSLNIPDSVTKIGGGAFSWCESLQSIIIPESVKEIDSYAFYSCTSLQSIDIPNSVTAIGDHAFQHCESLEKIKLPTRFKDDLIQICIDETQTKVIWY